MSPDKEKFVKVLHEEREKHMRLVKSITTILTEICAKDGHVMVDDGHDSHYNWQKCVVCNATERS